MGDVLGIKNHCGSWTQLTFTQRAFGWSTPKQRLECKIRFLMRYGLAQSYRKVLVMHQSAPASMEDSPGRAPFSHPPMLEAGKVVVGKSHSL